MKSCSQLGWLPRTAMVVLFTFCTFSVTYVLNFSAAGERGNGRLSPPGSISSPQPGGWTSRPGSQNRQLSSILKITRGKWRPSLKGLVFIWEDRQEGLTGHYRSWRVQGQPQLQNEFQASLASLGRPCPKIYRQLGLGMEFGAGVCKPQSAPLWVSGAACLWVPLHEDPPNLVGGQSSLLR